MTPLPRTLLVISAEERARDDLRRGFRAAGHNVMTVSTPAEAEEVLVGIGVDAVLVHGDDAMMETVRTFAGEVPVLQVVRDEGDECEVEEAAPSWQAHGGGGYVN